MSSPIQPNSAHEKKSANGDHDLAKEGRGQGGSSGGPRASDKPLPKSAHDGLTQQTKTHGVQKPVKSPISKPQSYGITGGLTDDRYRILAAMGHKLARNYGFDSFPSTHEGAQELIKRMAKEKHLPTQMDDSPKTRYEKWLEHKKELEERLRKFEEQEAAFLLRWNGQSGERPSTEEIREYETLKQINANRQRELEAVRGRVKYSFDLTNIPKTIDDAMLILKRMARSNSMFIKPRDLRDAVPLAAPGGVVDEVEVNKDVEMIQERMLKAKQEALVKRKMEDAHRGATKGKKKKGGKNPLHQSVGNVQATNESKSGNEEDKSGPLPGDDLWYSTLVFPQLAKELVEVSKVLEENLGKEGAIAALNTSLMEEALAVDKAIESLDHKNYQWLGQGQTTKIEQLGDHFDTRRLYDETAISLGDTSAAVRLVGQHALFGMQTEEATQILKSVIERGFADAAVYYTLADLYLNHKYHGTYGMKAEECYRLASESQPTKPGDSRIVQDALAGRVRLYAIGCDPIPADPVYAAYLLSQIPSTSDDLEPLTFARMYRFGFWKKRDWHRAIRCYEEVLSGSVRSYDEFVKKEAKDFVERLSVPNQLIDMYNEKETKVRLRHLQTTANLHPGIPDVYAYLAGQHLTEKGDQLNLKKAKEYLDKGLQHLSSKDPISSVRLLCNYVSYYSRVNDTAKLREYLNQVEALVDSVPVDLRMVINRVAQRAYCYVFNDNDMQLKALNRLIKDGDFGSLVDKGNLSMSFIGLSVPSFTGLQDAYQCFIEAEKYLSKDPKRYQAQLAKAYLSLGLMHMPNTPRPFFLLFGQAKNNKPIPPIDREKAREYLQKSIASGEHRAWSPLGSTYHSKTHTWNIGKDDEVKAAKCYIKAIELGKGDAICYFELAYLLLHGRGVTQDLKKAKEYYNRALAEGNPIFRASLAKHFSEIQAQFNKIE